MLRLELIKQREPNRKYNSAEKIFPCCEKEIEQPKTLMKKKYI